MIIVAVPTPVDSHRTPDLTPVIGASRTVGRHMAQGLRGVLRIHRVPRRHRGRVHSPAGKGIGHEFSLPTLPWATRRAINPGDKAFTGSKPSARLFPARTNPPPTCWSRCTARWSPRASTGLCIKVAEAAKVIENTQRDINIALMNELALIFNRLGIDTLEVKEAAGSKWNFLPFRPGLVGGHCIGVDPYYLGAV